LKPAAGTPAVFVVGATGFRTMVPAASMSGVTFAYKGAVRRAFVGLSWVSEYLGAGTWSFSFVTTCASDWGDFISRIQHQMERWIRDLEKEFDD
jgi:hypothetical protein